MLRKNAGVLSILFAVVSVMSAGKAEAQPWDIFEGDCDVINASNAGLVIIDDQFWVITDGPDFPLEDSFITAELDVFYGGIPSGSVVFDIDADGFETLFWVTDFGTVVEIDLDTLEIFDSDFAPGEIGDTFCDPCEFWDDPLDCEVIIIDEDDDGVPDDIDECLDTPLDEVADEFGCSCSQLDSDNDGVDDCFDECPDTFPGEIPDELGCSCEDLDDCDVIVEPGPIFVSCAALQPWFFGVIFLGLLGLRSASKRG